MKAINEQSVKQAIIENITAYPEDYSIQEVNGGVSPTDDCCSAIARYINNEYTNNPDCEKFNKDEFTKVCLAGFYSALELSDDSYSNTGDIYEFLKDEVNRYLIETSNN